MSILPLLIRADMAFDQFISGMMMTDGVDQRGETRGQIARYSLPIESPVRRVTQSADLVILNCITIYGGNQLRRRCRSEAGRRGIGQPCRAVITPIHQSETEHENESCRQSHPAHPGCYLSPPFPVQCHMHPAATQPFTLFVIVSLAIQRSL